MQPTVIRAASTSTVLYLGSRTPSAIRLSPDEYMFTRVAAIRPPAAAIMYGTRNQVGSGLASAPIGLLVVARLALDAVRKIPKIMRMTCGRLAPSVVQPTMARPLEFFG